MTCELFNGDCDECCSEYCPDQIEDLNFKHRGLKKDVDEAKKNLVDAELALESFIKDHQQIIV